MSAASSRLSPPPAPPKAEIDRFRRQHLVLAEGQIETEHGRARVTFDEGESPLAWLARRSGRNGRALIAPHQFLAGERLRAEFTHAQLMPQTTSNLESPISKGRRGQRALGFSETATAARQRVRQALDGVGPEFSGLLLDVCCFLKGLEDVERERGWPARSGKVVLQLALERLARHYGYAREARGEARTAIRTWLSDDASFSVEI